MLTKKNSLLSRLPARISFGLKISNKNVNSTYSNVASTYCDEAIHKKNGVSRLQNELFSQKTNNETIPVSLQHFIRPAAKHSIFTQIKGYGERSRPEFERPITLEELKSLDYESGKHFVPQSFSDTFAFLIVKGLRAFADLYFQKDYVRRVVVLETVAAIPGMVGGMFRHLYSLRNLEDNGEAIKKLVLEAENERQHLLTFLAVLKPNTLDRMLIKLGQFLFFNGYMVFYFVAPRTAHRFVGYLEEEAVRSYDAFEEEILLGHIKNVEAPRISKDYWNLPEEAMLIDVVRAVRADEAEHRDVNHKMADSKSFSLAHNPY